MCHGVVSSFLLLVCRKKLCWTTYWILDELKYYKIRELMQIHADLHSSNDLIMGRSDLYSVVLLSVLDNIGSRLNIHN